MRKIKHPKIGEYALVAQWSDKDPRDPWYVGLAESIIETKSGLSYTIKGSGRAWKHIWRITKEEGEDWLCKYGRFNHENS